MKALGERIPNHPRKVKKSYLTPKLLVVEKNIQNLNNFGRESYKRKFYLYTILNSCGQLEEIYQVQCFSWMLKSTYE